LTDLIVHAVGLKAAVVEKDELEAGLRKSLNVGHTIGHALEASTRYSLKHGDGVAIGMAAEARVAVALGVLPQDDAKRLLRTLRAVGLPTSLPARVKPSLFAAALALDKKSDVGGTKYVLLRSIGRCAIGVPVPDAVLRGTLGIGSRRGGRTT
jgi:3-dehydroquinate synthase